MHRSAQWFPRVVLDRRRALTGLVAALIGAAGSKRPAAATAQDDLAWETFPEMLVARSEQAAAAIDGAIYVVGGFGGGTILDRFDTRTQTWDPLAAVPVDVNHGSAAALDGKLHITGGYDQNLAALADHWVYDAATDTWQEAAPLPTARGALGLVALDGKLYAVGGTTVELNGPVTGAVDAYDPATDTWTALTTMPTPREHLAVAAGDGKLWTAGGRANRNDGAGIAGTAEAYDVRTDTWEELPPLTSPRAGIAGAWVAGRFVTLGGETIFSALDPLVHADAEAYAPAEGDWVVLPPLPTPRHGLAAAAVAETVFAIGGGPIAGDALAVPAVEALTFPVEE